MLKNKRVIIDASFIRACPCNGIWLKDIVNNGATLVLIDTFLYELCSTDKNRDVQWISSLKKLQPFSERIEIMSHIMECIRFESGFEDKYPFQSYEEMTKQFRKMLYENNFPKLEEKPETINEFKEEREGSVSLMIDFCCIYRKMLSDFPDINKIAGKSPEYVKEVCFDFVNNKDLIQYVLSIAPETKKISKVCDENWFIWHFGKFLLAIICEAIRSQLKPEEASLHKWINNKHDFDYLVSLSRADILVTNDKKTMSNFCYWMYGNTKTVKMYSKNNFKPEAIF
jgi:hypothetical protein